MIQDQHFVQAPDWRLYSHVDEYRNSLYAWYLATAPLGRPMPQLHRVDKLLRDLLR